MHLSNRQKGYTLIEFMIVIALLAILAAIIIPNIVTFVMSGDVGAGRSERAVLQTGVDGMMADAAVTRLTAQVTGWDGNTAGVVTVTSNGYTYDAVNYIRRSASANSEWAVTIEGAVICTQWDNSTDADFLSRINT
jgi:prepilin-type N-terminal cleavage/methylation domain-containing protein